MPLPTPILDDRSWQELRDELVRRIPVYTPEWTDHNASDPGIALLELFAYLGENLLFRFNQIPEATRLAFLRLLDIPLRPARPAHGLVTATTRSGAGTLVETGAEAKAGDVAFETTGEVHVWPLDAVAAVRLRSREPATPEEMDFAGAAALARGGLGPDEVPAYYEVVALPTDPAAPGATPVDAGAAVDGMLWLAVKATRYTDPGALGGAILNVGFLPEPTVASMDDVEPCPGEVDATPAPGMVWQASAGVSGGGDPVYKRLEVVGDGTRGLTREGVVRLQLPREATALAGIPQPDPDLAGTGDFPPVLEDLADDDVLFWIRVGRSDGARPLGAVRWLGLNAVPVRQSVKARPEYLGGGDGQPGQEASLVHAPVLEGTLALEVEEAGAWRRWTAVDGFQASGPDDRHYVLDPEAGTVRFGDGLRGRPPQIGERIRAVEYRWGGGTAGNVAAGKVSRFPDHPDLKAANVMPTTGGAEAETVDDALERIPGELRRRDRAVTRGDFRELALQTPGVQVGRAETIPLFHPPSRSLDAAGCVAVVVWPATDPRHPDAPTPTRGFLEEVCAWLDQRRLVTTELHVIPPTYRKVAVSAGVHVSGGYGVEAVRRWVDLVLRQYLAPLPPYGPEGEGWPLGRRVYGPELEAAALQVEGVAYVEGSFRLSEWREADGDTPAGWVEVEGDVELEPWEVPELAALTVVEGAPPEPGSDVAPAAPPAPVREVPIPLPVLRDVC